MALACASDVVVVATSRGFLLRYHWDDFQNEKGEDVLQVGLYTSIKRGSHQRPRKIGSNGFNQMCCNVQVF